MGGDDFGRLGFDDRAKFSGLADGFGAVGGLQTDGFAASVNLVAVEVDFAGPLGENGTDGEA